MLGKDFVTCGGDQCGSLLVSLSAVVVLSLSLSKESRRFISSFEPTPYRNVARFGLATVLQRLVLSAL